MEAVPEAESEALEPPESTDSPGTGPPEHTEVDDAPAAAPPAAITDPKRRRRLRAARLKDSRDGPKDPAADFH